MAANTTIETKKYGEVTVRTAMFDTGRHDLVEGIELKFDSELIEVHGYYDIDELTPEEVENLIDENS